MDNTTRPTLHPALMIAAVSVTALSLAGVGVLTGVIPFNQKHETAATPAAQTQAAVQPATQPAAAPTVAVNIANSPAPTAKAAAAAPKAVHVARKKEPADIEVYRAERSPSQIRTSAQATNQAPAQAPICRDCGTIESVHEVVKEADGSGIGAVAGGVLGGVLGNQVGNGRGRDLATVIGAVGGAVAGNQVEKAQKRTVEYEVTVRFEDGTSRVFTQKTPPTWRNGDRVKVENGLLVSRA